MPDVLIDWIVRFSTQCALNYATISVATAFVCFVMALVLLLVRQQVLKEERWLWYVGLAFGTFTLQYGARSAAAWIRNEYSSGMARYFEGASQAIFSTLNSLLFLLAGLALLYRLPADWWKTRWQLLIFLFAASNFLGLALSHPWDRYVDGGLSAVGLLILNYAMYASSGIRQRRGWALANLAGGIGYAGLQLLYAVAPTFSRLPSIAAPLRAAVEKYESVAVLDPQRILDAGLFGLAFAFKVSLFIGVLLVVMRSLAVFSPSDVLQPMKFARGEFLGSSGIVQAMGESIGADTAALYFRLPSSNRDEVQSFRWWCDPMRPYASERFSRPSPNRSITGQALVAEDIVWSRNVEKDPRFEGLDTTELGVGMRSFLIVPLRYHGAVVGSLNFAWKKTSAFTATDVQRARQIGDFVTPVVQTERWLRAASDLRQRLQHYQFPQEEIEQGTFIARVAQQLHDVLSPEGTLVIIDFGFGVQWAFCDRGIRSSDDSKESVTLADIEDQFRRVMNGLEAREEETLLLLGGESVGKIVFAAGSGHDPLDRPSLTQDNQQLSAIAALVRDVVFDLQRKRFSDIIHRLHSRLNTESVTPEAHWIRSVCEAVAEAGLCEVGISPNRSRLNRDEQPEITIPREALTSPEEHGGYVIHQWRPAGGLQQSVLELPLTSSDETLFVAIPRSNFGRELDGELPWKLFFDQLTAAADSTLVRIRAIELESKAMQFEISDLLVHELRSPAEEFRLGTEVMQRTLKLDAKDPRLELLSSLQRSASKFLELANELLNPLRLDDRRFVPLREVLDQVERFYDTRLRTDTIELRRAPVDDNWSIGVPFHLAYVVLLSLIRNSKDAIGEKKGQILVHAEAGPDSILLHVDDTGSGIPEERRDDVFVMGYSTKPRGTGRGLPLARRALHRHDGDLVLAETAPEGVSTRFTISFPRERS